MHGRIPGPHLCWADAKWSWKHTACLHNCNRYQGVKLSVCRIRIGFISKPKMTQILFNSAKVYTCSLKWDLQDKVFPLRGPAAGTCSCSQSDPNRAQSTDASYLTHKVTSWAPWFLTTSFSFQSLSLSACACVCVFVCVCVCTCSVFGGVSPPRPHHLCSIRLIVL